MFSLLFFMSGFPVSHSNPEIYLHCHDALFECGKISVGYPFFGGNRGRECGLPGLELLCHDATDTTTIEIAGVKYQVLDISRERQTLTIVREDLFKHDFCRLQTPIRDFVMDSELFDPAPGYTTNVTLSYDCPSSVPSNLGLFHCDDSKYNSVSVTTDVVGADGCSARVTFPIANPSGGRFQFHNESHLLSEALKKGFKVKWKYTPTNGGNTYSQGGNANNNRLKLGLGIAGAGAGSTIACILIGIGILRFRQRRQKKIAAQVTSRDLLTSQSTSTSQSNSSYSTSKCDIERGSTYFGAHVFSYEELQEASNNFSSSKQLGEGGFGTVYYGELRDGRIVAIKRLYDNNFKRVDRYMNEIEILTRIRHPNLVILYGCTSRRSRELLLVYEYIPNGTLADHLHGKRSNSGSLTWHVRLSIAVEAALALAYLHASEIIHRDVKSNNILLDNNFHVKVADFGLSRLFPNDVTHISTAPQGTPGYVDPEYHQCYQLTEKSDVYSFGVVLIELVSAKQAVDIHRHRHDINLASMAISRIQNQALHELVDPSLGFEDDCDLKNTVTAVAELAFRCLQQEREMRPSMEEVLATLKEIEDGGSEAEVVASRSDDVGASKSIPPPLSPDYETDKWVQIRSM
ncbi:LEAF RUST 10 DISEASE-RESISTANCE LOCUS RECEPTOR-LIKE PROTEIN KINASE-like 1.3 [Hibiscus syriacus]|uniref:LEAF RUST 10 DISEASE-RESISTANCE LOCUS RECEPTOR-LIKE PROTEIN KINASE-like 1.3 n=1 Tax=Hibiscus syriacus TaxID=106335 RepID=UPI0019219CD3|nr:LEAF RUST 10 DISEASE-RESISTANCE LOCUS RECEPTOR-LIKE PROTEIN KINASE-like 1.3 [Hibiscus syriacus]